VTLSDAWRAELARYGITFENLQSSPKFPPAWQYDHDLLWRVWKDFPRTDWGERAFVALLEHGWHTKAGCGGGSDPSQPYLNNRGDDQFPDIIEQGERFLAERPASAQLNDVLLAVAQAYETWWSLSLASRDEYVSDARKYQRGATAARGKSIQLYEELMRRAPESDMAAYVTRHLPRLKLGVDTEQRRYYCVLRD
jgi:hypothetical protein